MLCASKRSRRAAPRSKPSNTRGVSTAKQLRNNSIARNRKCPSTPQAVSFSADSSGVTLAVAASNHDVCAFGRWSVNAGAEYVTMAHVNPCRAVDAPVDGWTSEAGGAASDLPDENS